MPPTDIDFSEHSMSEVDQSLGELVRMLLSRDGLAVLALRGDGKVITTLSPSIALPSDDLATALLSAGWPEEHVLQFLDQRRTL